MIAFVRKVFQGLSQHILYELYKIHTSSRYRTPKIRFGWGVLVLKEKQNKSFKALTRMDWLKIFTQNFVRSSLQDCQAFQYNLSFSLVYFSGVLHSYFHHSFLQSFLYTDMCMNFKSPRLQFKGIQTYSVYL